MKSPYRRPPERRRGLRLHLNENTAGCSSGVLDALRSLDRGDLASYPEYATAFGACAAHFGVAVDELLLTNGLDEGILCTALLAFRSDRHREGYAVIVQPAFDMYAICTTAAGGRVVFVPPRDDFSFPIDDVLRQLSSDTRIVFLTTPHSPSGQNIPAVALERVLISSSADTLVFVDETYADFSGETMLPHFSRYPNLIIGRTFSKAYGLAGVRIGAVIGSRETIRRLGAIVPPYSVNVVAAAAIVAGLNDREYVAWYVDQVKRSREMLYRACTELSLKYWPSAANFVLVHAGDRVQEVVAGLSAREIYVKDLLEEPGCAGCCRISVGLIEHTERCIDALREILCDKV